MATAAIRVLYQRQPYLALPARPQQGLLTVAYRSLRSGVAWQRHSRFKANEVVTSSAKSFVEDAPLVLEMIVSDYPEATLHEMATVPT